MCYGIDSEPPAPSAGGVPVEAAEQDLTSADGVTVGGFAALPRQPGGVGVVVLPDNQGLSEFYRRFAVQIAEQGHPAVALDYRRRDGRPDTDPEAPLLDRVHQLSSRVLDAYLPAALDWLRSPAGGACRAVVPLGFCLGGRLAFLAAAARYEVAGVIGLYGGPDALAGRPGPTQLAGTFTAPVLGLFGGADEHIPADSVAAFTAALAAAGVDHDVVTYPGAPHSFFDRHRTEYAEQSRDAWRRMLTFLRDR